MRILRSRYLLFVNGSDDLEKGAIPLKMTLNLAVLFINISIGQIIVDIQQHVKQDRQLTVSEIAETFSISYGSAQKI